MQKSKILAPVAYNEEANDEKISSSKDNSSLSIPKEQAIDNLQNCTQIPIKENNLNNIPPMTTLKANDIQRIRTKKSIFSQEEKVRYLLDKINYHLTAAIGNNITVADVTGNCKPLHQEFDILPKIHFDFELDKQQSYRPNPFKISNLCRSTTNSKYSSIGNQVDNISNGLNLLSENDSVIKTNYCGHCKKHFINSAAHRLTGYHQTTISSAKHWEKIDQICQRISNNSSFSIKK